MAYLKRYLIPEFWPLARKAHKWATSPRPGPHSKYMCIPLKVVVRDVLHYAENGPEANKIIKSGEILVDKKVRKDPNYPVGLMDVIEVPKTQKVFRVVVEKNGFVIKETKAEESDKKLCKIRNKKVIKGGLVQLNLHDGRNILVSSQTPAKSKKTVKISEEKDVYKTNDSVLIQLPDQKVLKHFKFDKGSPAIITGGKNMGVRGEIKEISKKKNMLEKNTVILETDKGEIKTDISYVLVGELK